MQLPMTGPAALNPIVWGRRFATPRGQASLLLLASIFLLLMTWHDVTSSHFYSRKALVVGCVGVPLGVWCLVTGISPTSPARPRWWWLVGLSLAGAGLMAAIRVMQQLDG
jgi:hypothetical protein